MTSVRVAIATALIAALLVLGADVAGDGARHDLGGRCQILVCSGLAP